MRIGRWVPIYKRLLPIPRRLAMAFGLYEGSQLYFSRITDENDQVRRYGSELIVSPVPFESWASACRLSVRLNDTRGALATASRFLRERHINIMLSECCSTYQHRAHWDAICDIARVPEYRTLEDVPRERYDESMQAALKIIELDYKRFAEKAEHRDAFLHGPEFHIQLTPLTGLNDVSFVCTASTPESYRDGAVELSRHLAQEVCGQCHTDTLPQYALITGNTEQRYMRVLFLRDYEQMFELTIHDRIENFAGGGIGVLNQLVTALPPAVNLMRVSTYIVKKTDKLELGRIEVLGHWDLPQTEDPDSKRGYMEGELKRVLRELEITDIRGDSHARALEEVDFVTPKARYPRVFISYSTSYERKKLARLEKALLANHFEPVLGTDLGQPSSDTYVGHREVTPDVMHVAFQAMQGCVAFVSLQVRRDDYKVTRNGKEQYVLPPWAIAEEVYAWASKIPFIIRLRDAGVEEPPYNKNTLSKTFTSDNDYGRALDQVVEALLEFRAGPIFRDIKESARQAVFRKRTVPEE